MLLEKIVEVISGKSENVKKVKGTVVLMKKNVLDFNDVNASLLDGVLEFLGKRVSLQLISAVHADPGKHRVFLLSLRVIFVRSGSSILVAQHKNQTGL